MPLNYISFARIIKLAKTSERKEFISIAKLYVLPQDSEGTKNGCPQGHIEDTP